jgi:hypothetical protein
LTLPPTLPSSPGKQKGGDGRWRRKEGEEGGEVERGRVTRTGRSRAVGGDGDRVQLPKGWGGRIGLGFFNPFLCIDGCWITWAI